MLLHHCILHSEVFFGGSCRGGLLCLYENKGGKMEINIPGAHQRHSILLNIFPLRLWLEHCRSFQQSRKSETDSSTGNNGQNPRRLLRNRSHLLFALLEASRVLFLYTTQCSHRNALVIVQHQNYIMLNRITTHFMLQA